MLSLSDMAAAIAFVEAARTSRAAYDHVHAGISTGRRDRDIETVERYVGLLPEHLVRRFIEEGETAATEFIERYPDTDRQRLRSLARSVTSAVSDDKRSAAARSLFKYLREVMVTGPVQARDDN